MAHFGIIWEVKNFQDIRWLENCAKGSKKALSPIIKFGTIRDYVCPDMEVIGFEKSCS